MPELTPCLGLPAATRDLLAWRLRRRLLHRPGVTAIGPSALLALPPPPGELHVRGGAARHDVLHVDVEDLRVAAEGHGPAEPELPTNLLVNGNTCSKIFKA